MNKIEHAALNAQDPTYILTSLNTPTFAQGLFKAENHIAPNVYGYAYNHDRSIVCEVRWSWYDGEELSNRKMYTVETFVLVTTSKHGHTAYQRSVFNCASFIGTDKDHTEVGEFIREVFLTP